MPKTSETATSKEHQEYKKALTDLKLRLIFHTPSQYILRKKYEYVKKISTLQKHGAYGAGDRT